MGLVINKHQQVAADSVKVAALKVGTAYTGELKHPSYPNQAIVFLSDLTSATDGLWKEVEDTVDDDQKLKMIQYGQRLKFTDGEAELIGMPDAEGTIRDDFVHQGIGGGSFMRTPEAPSDDEAVCLQLEINMS